jgi:TorA maturation chaperone TorD
MKSVAQDIPDPLAGFRAAVAHDVLALALLHNEELSSDMISKLAAEEFPLCLQLELISDKGREATQLLQEGVRLIAQNTDSAMLDELAADYAGVYLTHALRASPYESVWIDEEGLAMQEPMFQIREAYRRHGLGVRDWRKRSDDHLVLQMQFVAHLFEKHDNLGEVADFLDEHLLRWLPDFASIIASRSATPFYAGLGIYTAAYMDEVRDLLAEILDQPRPAPEEIERRLKPAPSVALPVPQFVPGSAPSW